MGLNWPIDITAEQRKTVLALLARHLPNTMAWVYGSRVKWTARPESDLDLVVFARPEQSGRVSDLREAFEESNLPFRVDLFVWDDVPEQFRKQIEAEHVVLVERRDPSVGGEWRDTPYGLINADFAENRLADLCNPVTGIQTGPFGSQLHKKDYAPVGTPIITVEHLGENRILHEGVPCVSEKDRLRLSKYWLRKGDIVFSRVGSVDRRALVRDGEDGWLFSGRCLRVRPNSNYIDAAFLSYFFGLPAFKEHIRALAVGATMPSLNTQILSDISVPHPESLEEQRSIAHVLGTLDDKVELNRQMNRTLEEMARALFKSWFVDFNPVRAKATLKTRAGTLPQGVGDWSVERANAYLDRMDPNVAALFPDRFVDSELGPIPEGWEVKALGDIAAQRRSGVNPKQIDPGTPYIALEHMPKRCIALPEWDTAGGLASSKFRFEQRDILFGKLRPYFHKVGVAPLGGVCSTDIVVISPVSAEWFGFVLGHASSSEFVYYTDATSTGTKMPRTNWTDMSRYQIPLPSQELAEVFTKSTQPAIDRIVSSIHESCSLTAVRDTLLPKLVSGKLRVAVGGNAGEN